MAQQVEYFVPTDNDNMQIINSANWGFQGFTIGTAGSNITTGAYSVKVKGYIVSGAPGILTFSLRATSGDTPTGADLCSGTIDSSVFAANPGDWQEIVFTTGAGATISASTKYAIIYRMADPGTWNMRERYLTSTYSGGNTGRSNDSGATWPDNYTNQDIEFEYWGTVGINTSINIGDAWKTIF